MRLSVVRPLALLPLVAACRLDFDPLPPTPGGPAPDAPPAVLPCGAPPQFSIPTPAGATLNALAAMATDTDYTVFAVDSGGAVYGFSYAFDGTQLAPRAVDAPVFMGATGTVAASDTGNGALAAIAYGRPDALGTALVPLDAQLALNGSEQKQMAWLAVDSAVARAADGTLAFLAQQNGGAAAKLVSPSGTDLGASHLVVDGSEGVSVATITPAGTQFLVTWTATTPSPNQVRAELIDEQLSVMPPGPTTINTGAMSDGDSPRAGAAAAADRFLFAWSFKNAANGDELWVSLRDGQLTELKAIQLSTHGVQPRVVAGKDDFLVAWKDGAATAGISAARVGFDGSVASLVVSGNGKALAWDLTARAGQPALIWIENAMVPSMRLDPLCN